MYRVDEALKWYVDSDYLELFHPLDDCIVEVKCEGIEKIWDLLINKTTMDGVLRSVKPEEMKFVRGLFRSLHTKKYIHFYEDE